MTLTTKYVILGVGFLAAFISLRSALHSSSIMPKITTLGFTPDENFGTDFYPYLASTELEENGDGGEGSFHYKGSVDKSKLNKEDRELISDKFSGFTSKAAFKEVCQTAYEESTEKIEQDTKYLNSIGRYCSIFNKKPTTISEFKHPLERKYLMENSGINNGGTLKKDELVSTEDPDNDFFGREKEKHFLHGFLQPSSIQKPNKNAFDRLYERKLKNSKHHRTLRETCKESYERIGSILGDLPTEEEILKYCGLKIYRAIPTSPDND